MREKRLPTSWVCGTKQRFNAFVEVQESGCWHFIGSSTLQGYGQFSMGGIVYLAHRLAYFWSKGKDPLDKLVMHTCDNPTCVNPDHLVIGTVLDNNRDRDSKGRQVSGTIILTEGEVLEIRRLYATGSYTQKALGDLFGVTRWNILLIVNRRSWKHV